MTKKYKIKQLLGFLNHTDYKKAMKELPVLIGKCKNTLMKYIEADINSPVNISYEVGRILENYFGMPPGSLSNVNLDA